MKSCKGKDWKTCFQNCTLHCKLENVEELGDNFKNYYIISLQNGVK
jgi:hypothetical protein